MPRRTPDDDPPVRRPRPRPTVADARRLARRSFVAGRRLDMSELAAELGVNRGTVYRWVGSRDAALVEVLWSLTERTFAAASRGADGQGGERIVSLIGEFLEVVIDDKGLQTFLRDEGELAMRLLTRADLGYQPRLVAAVRAELEQEVASGALHLDVEISELAFVLVRLIGTYTYLDLLTGETPDARRAEPILRMLLR